MEERKYYSARGENRKSIDLETLKEIIKSIFVDYKDRTYFTHHLYGVHGKAPLITDAELYFRKKLLKLNLWPIESRIKSYSEEDLFDVIELLYDLISKPVIIIEPLWGNHGMPGFDRVQGQKEFQKDISKILRGYQDGYELSKDGEILSIGDLGFEDLLNEELPVHDPENIDDQIKIAVSKFRRHHSSVDDKKDAVKDLAAILEFLRPKFKELQLSKDENDIFNIANNFAIRHHNRDQNTDYDKSIWFTWTFYAYLATIHVVIKLLNKNNVEITDLPLSNQDR